MGLANPMDFMYEPPPSYVKGSHDNTITMGGLRYTLLVRIIKNYFIYFTDNKKDDDDKKESKVW
jgi:hypothetical protein